MPDSDYTEIRDERIRGAICELMSEMLDNPDEFEIYLTSRFMWKMETFILAEIARLQAIVDKQQVEIQMHRDKARGDYWAWQGDGEDHLESLVCPVLIHPAELSKIVAAAEAAGRDDG